MSVHVLKEHKIKEKVSKLTYPTLQHCLRMLHIMKGGIGQSGSKPPLNIGYKRYT